MEFFEWNFDPILFRLGGLEVRWYGLCFASAIMAGYGIGYWIFKREGKDCEHLDPLLYRLVAGIIIGARLGHCLFYEPTIYLKNPLRILKVWEGGLASHGAVIGIFLALFFFRRKYKDYTYLGLLDMMTMPAMVGSAFIRLGNFFNSEIIGVQTEVPWAIVFKRIDNVPRHPVQLYESITYLFIFILFLLLYTKTGLMKRKGALVGLLLMLVFSARFGLEFFKTKQSEFGAELIISMGQWLSVPLVILGAVLFFMSNSKEVSNG